MCDKSLPSWSLHFLIYKMNDLNFRSYTYFANGCLFEENTDNLIAFPVYDSATEERVKYLMVVKE